MNRAELAGFPDRDRAERFARWLYSQITDCRVCGRHLSRGEGIDINFPDASEELCGRCAFWAVREFHRL